MTGCRVLVVDDRRLVAAALAGVLAERVGIDEVEVLPELAALPVALARGWTVVLTSDKHAGHVLRLAPQTTRVLVALQHPDVPALAHLLRRGAAGVCTPDGRLDDIVAAVEQVARGEMRLPGHLVHDVLCELQRLRSQADVAEELVARLTSRERDVLVHLGQGRGRTEIARELRLSPHTVRTHVQHLLNKLGLHSQQEAGAFARDLTPVVIDLDAHRRGAGAPHRP